MLPLKGYSLLTYHSVDIFPFMATNIHLTVDQGLMAILWRRLGKNDFLPLDQWQFFAMEFSANMQPITIILNEGRVSTKETSDLFK